MKLVLKNETPVEPVIAFELRQSGPSINLVAFTENSSQILLVIENIDNKVVARCVGICGDTAVALGYNKADKFICTEAE